MTPAEDVTAFAREHLRSIAGLSGYLLYSAAETLRPSDVYLLGHNPGGSPKGQYEATVAVALRDLPKKTINNYLDEAWTMASGRRFEIGDAPLQRRVVWLLQHLGFDPRGVPASNVVFVRSVDAAASRFEELAALCWPVHERIIQYVKPKLLLVFGNSTSSPYSFIRAQLGGGAETAIDAGHPPWQCRSFVSRRGTLIVGLPHLSRYNVIGKTAIVEWIRRQAAL